MTFTSLSFQRSGDMAPPAKMQACKRAILGQTCRPTFWRDVAVELVATFLLVAVQCNIVLSWGRMDVAAGSVSAVGLGMAFIVMVLVWALGDYSGCHMNPAISFSLALCSKISPTRAIMYIISQCIGGIAGAAFIYVMTPASHHGNLAATLLSPELTWWQGVFVEMWITFILVLAVLGSTDSRRNYVSSPAIPIGLAVGLGAMNGYMATGSSMNPARSLGPAVLTGHWAYHWIYWVAPLLGGALATFVYNICFDRITDPDPAKCPIEDQSPGDAAEGDHETIDMETKESKTESAENGVETVTATEAA